MSVVVLLILLFLLLYFSYLTSKRNLCSPQFGFTISFVPQTIMALFYIKKWQLDISIQTVLVIAGGVLLFIICNLGFGVISANSKGYNVEKNDSVNNNIFISIDGWKMLFVIFFQLATIMLCVRYLLSLAPGASLIASITYYRYTNLFSEDLFVIPGYIRMMRTFCISSGYIFSYLYIHSMFYKDKFNKVYVLANILLSIVNDIILGARTGLATFAVAFLVQYFFIRGKKLGWKNALPFKAIVKILVALFVFVGTFQLFAQVMGRSLATSYTFMDYIAGYLSAELKNLDTFIKQGIFGSTMENNQTLNGIIPLLAKIFNQPQWVHKLDLPFVIEQGYNYGNVYTIFYPFLYDLGYIGLFVYIPIMAFICQIIYKKCIRFEDNTKISISLVVYSYLFFAIVFSFFSDKFYEIVFNTKFIWTVLSWIVLKYYFEIKIKILMK